MSINAALLKRVYIRLVERPVDKRVDYDYAHEHEHDHEIKKYGKTG